MTSIGRTISIIQPALPVYRLDFFQRLADRYGGAFRVYYSPVDMGALTSSKKLAFWERPLGRVCRPFPGIEWQVGALSVPVNKGDLVVVCGAPRSITTLLLLVKVRMKGAQSIWWGQYWSATSEPHRHGLRMKLSRLADALLFYTEAEVARFHADGWTHPGPVGALNNGIDLTKVRRLRYEYDPAERGGHLLFIGRLTEKAKLDLMVSALADPRLRDCHLHVIGEGSQGEALRAQAVSKGVTSRITWHGGTTDEARIAEIANRCAAFVYPGQVGLSLIHAMGYGLPCVVHDEPLRHMPEIAAFSEGSTGMTFRQGSVPSLATIVASLLNAPKERCNMSACNINITRNDYTTSGMANRFIMFLSKFDQLTRGFK